MSVHKPKKGATYVYDFWIGGRRFCGSTGETDKRSAQDFERRRRIKAKEEIAAAGKSKDAPMTLMAACHTYFEEVGKFQKRADNVEWSLAWLAKHLGGGTPLVRIGNPEVARIVAIRRGEFAINRAAETETKVERRRRKRLPPKLVSPARVNRSVTEPLRKILNRARDVWEVQVRPIRWSDHILKEPKERVRELLPEEEARLFASIRPAFHDLLRVSIMTGHRETNLITLKWAQVDFGGRQITVTAKGDRTHTIPMTPALRAILWAQRGRHAEQVWTYENGSPMTVAGVVSALKRACGRGKIDDFHFHDLRHTAATRMLRKTGNLKHAQELLGHTEIATTSRYAHVTKDDLRSAMEAAGGSVNDPVNLADDPVTREKSA